MQNYFPEIFTWYKACPIVSEIDQHRTEKVKKSKQQQN